MWCCGCCSAHESVCDILKGTKVKKPEIKTDPVRDDGLRGSLGAIWSSRESTARLWTETRREQTSEMLWGSWGWLKVRCQGPILTLANYSIGPDLLTRSHWVTSVSNYSIYKWEDDKMFVDRHQKSDLIFTHIMQPVRQVIVQLYHRLNVKLCFCLDLIEVNGSLAFNQPRMHDESLS